MAGIAKQEDREQARERHNALRIIGGLLLIMALLLYFFHMAEAPERSALGVLAALFAVCGAALLWVGWHRIRALR
jgi:heme/copper-type cytochrome/quinol oxidase subunit 4